MTADDAASSASSPSLPPLPLAPSVSVIIPALHAADAVGHAIDSCLAQDQVVEVVVATGEPDTRQAVAAAAAGADSAGWSSVIV